MTEFGKPITSFFGEYRWLSNFYPAEVVYDGRPYPSVENAYQAAKTLNEEERKQFETLPANKAKSQGKKLIIKNTWDNEKELIMYELVKQKFQRPELKQKLIDTGDAPLVEGNRWGDMFWGVCNGRGQNKLGMILEHIRCNLTGPCED
jgi:hypothetical protein